MPDSSDSTPPEGLGPLTGPGGLPELAEMVWSFFGLLERRVGGLGAVSEAGDRERLLALRQQVQAVVEGASCPHVAASARDLAEGLTQQTDLDHLREKVEAMVIACRRVKRK